MALYFYELARSRPFERSADSASITLKWIGMYATDENLVATGLLVVAPLVWDGLRRKRYKCEPLGAGVWMCDVEYSFSTATATDNPGDGSGDTSTQLPTPSTSDDTALGPEFAFDITAGTVHVTQSLQTRLRWLPSDSVVSGNNLTVDATDPTLVTPDGHTVSAGDVGKTVYVSAQNDSPALWNQGPYTVVGAPGTKWKLNFPPAAVGSTGGIWTLVDDALNPVGHAPDYKQAIGHTLDQIQGTDVYTPKFEFSITASFFPLKLPYMRLVRALCARTNDRKWNGFAKGEVLYLGASGQCQPGNVWRVSHKFAVGENLYAVPVSTKVTDTGSVVPDIVIPYKGAWEYLWVAYSKEVKQDSLIPVPAAAYVERVYRSGNFALLGVGA